MKKKWLVVVLSVLSALAALLAFAACKDGGDLYSGPEHIAYDGQYITWDKVSTPIVGDKLGQYADYYNVSINGGARQRTNSTTYAYASADSFEVTVAAVFDGEEKTSASVTFKPLAPVAEVFVADDGSLSWDSVAGANAYSLSVNGKETTTTDTYFELPAGGSRVKVKPIVSGDPTFYSTWSDEVNVSVYNTPSNLKYDGAVLSWTGNATEYLVTVNGFPYTARGNSYSVPNEFADFTAEVKAIGNHTSTYDSKPASEEFHYLAPITDLVVEDGILKWSEVAGAEGYKVKIDGAEKALVTQAQYDKLITGKSQKVSVIPVNSSANYFSSWSDVKTVYLLATPTLKWNDSLELDGKEANNNITWNPVNAAGGYTVRLTKDGVVQRATDVSAAQLYFAEAYSDVGVYTVEVKACAESGEANYYDSKYSDPITVERLASPGMPAQNFIRSDPEDLTKGFTVNFIGVSGASGYQLYKNGVLLTGRFTANGSALSDNNIVDSSNMTEQHFSYIVRSMGGHKTLSNREYITLPSVTDPSINPILSFEIIVQATPQNLRMQGKDLFWDKIAGTNGYSVSYGQPPIMATAEKLDLSILNAGTYSVKVCARGDGSKVLASNYSSPVEIKRLEAPTNIRITSANNGTLQWDHDADTDSDIVGYSVYLGTSKTALDKNSYNNMYQFIDTNGTLLSMVADADKYSQDGTVYYMASVSSQPQQFIRLKAPTFPEGAVENNTELIWNAPGNINTSEYPPTYKLYEDADGKNPVTGGQLNGTRYNIAYLEGGTEYTFYVRAIGNDTKYLDSALSAEKKVTKLATPEFEIRGGRYVWKSIFRATSFIMTIDGVKVSDEFNLEENEYSYVPRFTSAGEHIVTLQAIGDGREYLNSKEYRYKQTATVLQTPSISYEYSAEAVTKDGTIDVTVTTPSPHATAYQYEIAGVAATSPELTFSKVMDAASGTFRIRVKAIGGLSDADEVYYIDSTYTGGSSTDTIVLLGKPNSDKFEFYYGEIKWGSVSGNFGYDYEISYDGGAFSAVTHTDKTSVKIDDYASHHTITIRVRAAGGNNGKTVASEWIEFTWTNPKA